MVKKLEELFEEIVLLESVISDFFPSIAFGECRAEGDDDDVNEFVEFAGMVTARVLEGTEMLDDIDNHSIRVQHDYTWCVCPTGSGFNSQAAET